MYFIELSAYDMGDELSKKSEKFQNSDFELPIALGKTISNETWIYDLTKMPHLLIAGATAKEIPVAVTSSTPVADAVAVPYPRPTPTDRENFSPGVINHLAPTFKPTVLTSLSSAAVAPPNDNPASKAILSLPYKVDGIFSANDVAAIGAIKFLKQENIKIPDDIAIVGFTLAGGKFLNSSDCKSNVELDWTFLVKTKSPLSCTTAQLESKVTNRQRYSR